MRPRTHLAKVLLGLGVIFVLVLTIASSVDSVAKETVTSQSAQLQQAYGKLPLSFEANRGQTNPQVKFVARGRGYTLFLTPTESVLSLRTGSSGLSSSSRLPDSTKQTKQTEQTKEAVLRMQLEGANPEAEVAGLEKLPGIVNYFIGNDPQHWRTNIPTYAKVEYRDVYPGVDLAYYGNERRLEYDFIVAPGADPRAIRLAFDGAEKLQLDTRGDLVLSTAAGELRMHRPLIYQVVNGIKQVIPGGYVVNPVADDRTPDLRTRPSPVVSFQVAAYDTSKPLVIDPVLAYSTYVGTTVTEGRGIAVDSDGNAYVTGVFALIPSFGVSASVTKLNPSGSAVVYSTELGHQFCDGNNCRGGNGIAADGAGNAYVIVTTCAFDFPTVNPLPGSPPSSCPTSSVAKLDASGSTLYITTLNGAIARGIAVDSYGNAYVTGNAFSPDFPTTAGAFQTPTAGFDNGFVVKLDASGALVYSTFLSGTTGGEGTSIAVDRAGNAYLTGFTVSANFPVTAGAVQPGFAGVGDAFVTKLNPTGSGLVYSTYLGGSGSDSGNGIAVDDLGNAYVTGQTCSGNFPTVNPVQATHGQGLCDAFVTKLNAAGSALIYSTFLGGSGGESGLGVAVDSAGNAYVTGYTCSGDFPTANPLYGPNMNPPLLAPTTPS